MEGRRAAVALGTANWGSRYGAPGSEQCVHSNTAAALAQDFVAAGHRLVDTAPAYGDAEALVGQSFRGDAAVITKLSAGPLGDLPGEEVLQSLRRSVTRTGVDRLYGVLLHDSQAALRAPRAARRVVDQIRDSQLSARVGVSVYTPEEAWAAVERLDADLVQVPCSVLDQRFAISGCIADLTSAGVEVHVRSIFLNGTLLADPSRLAPALEQLASAVRRLQQIAAGYGLSPLQMAVAHALDVVRPGAVIVGVLSTGQLAAVLDTWSSHTAPMDVDWSGLAVDSNVVDPRTWRR